jgi:Protein of unknown function (DUF3551)
MKHGRMMRVIPVAAAIAGAAFLLAPSDAKAQYSPWCAFYAFGGGSNCGFANRAQCAATVSGIGGWCQRNPYIAYGTRQRRKR